MYNVPCSQNQGGIKGEGGWSGTCVLTLSGRLLLSEPGLGGLSKSEVVMSSGVLLPDMESNSSFICLKERVAVIRKVDDATHHRINLVLQLSN